MGHKNKKNKKRKQQEDVNTNENTEDQVVDDVENEVTSKDEGGLKRSHTEVDPEDEEHDSDGDTTEKKRKKKKKKVQEVAEPGEKKGKKSIRQMKREKHALRQAEAAAASKDQLKSECLNYLSQWKHDKSNWKFMKVKQLWLFKNKFSASIPDTTWPVLLEYFESAQGNIRKLLLEDANKVIKQMDEWTESQNGKEEDKEDDEEETEQSIEKPTTASYKRARDLIQCLQE